MTERSGWVKGWLKGWVKVEMEVVNRTGTEGGAPRNIPEEIAVQLCRHLPRRYISVQLRRNNFQELACSLPRARFTSNNDLYTSMQEIADTLEEERGVQFDEMLFTMNVDRSNIEQTYDNIMYEMFSNSINWGKIITYITFSAHMAVYCASNNTLRDKVPDIVTWADRVMEEQLEGWIRRQGGLQAFLDHYDTADWQVNLSSGLLALGVVATIAIGLLALKELFT